MDLLPETTIPGTPVDETVEVHRPLPEVGSTVRYHPRPGEVRRGRTVVPAIVIWRDEDARTLDLCVIHEATDLLQQDRVPEWEGGDGRGWEAVAQGGTVTVDRAVAVDAEIRGEVSRLLRVVFGEYEEVPDKSLMGMLDTLDQRMDKFEKGLTKKIEAALEARVAPAAAKQAKAKRKGR